MLGVYDYTVVLTYVSLMVSIGGMMFASKRASASGRDVSCNLRPL